MELVEEERARAPVEGRGGSPGAPSLAHGERGGGAASRAAPGEAVALSPMISRARAVGGPEVEPAQRGGGLASEDHVLDGPERPHQHEVLVHHPDPAPDRLRGCRGREPLAVHPHLVPADGAASTPAAILSVGSDLPAPFSPRTAWRTPGPISTLAPSTARKSPKRRETAWRRLEAGTLHGGQDTPLPRRRNLRRLAEALLFRARIGDARRFLEAPYRHASSLSSPAPPRVPPRRRGRMLGPRDLRRSRQRARHRRPGRHRGAGHRQRRGVGDGEAPLLPEPQRAERRRRPRVPGDLQAAEQPTCGIPAFTGSDCSGLVSWAWGLPAPGRTTAEFAPNQSDITTAIQASALAMGDAVNTDDSVSSEHHIACSSRPGSLPARPPPSSRSPAAAPPPTTPTSSPPR